MSLAVHPCLAACEWLPTATTYDGLALFRCQACASEWTRAQAWTPVDDDGSRHPELSLEAGRSERG